MLSKQAKEAIKRDGSYCIDILYCGWICKEKVQILLA